MQHVHGLSRINVLVNALHKPFDLCCNNCDDTLQKGWCKTRTERPSFFEPVFAFRNHNTSVTKDGRKVLVGKGLGEVLGN
jgi:hypothetical protein